MQGPATITLCAIAQPPTRPAATLGDLQDCRMSATGDALSLLSGLLQAAGYVIYVRGSLRHEILPNPTTWLLFAYDTTLLARISHGK
jgi:hypothetical protein